MPVTELLNRPLLRAALPLVLLLGVACGGGSPTLAPATLTPTSDVSGVQESTPEGLPGTSSDGTPAAQVESTATPESEGGEATTPDPQEGGLGIRTAVVKLENGNASLLQDGDEMVSRVSKYGIFVAPTQDAHVYALQQDATGSVYVLFPNQDYSDQQNPVPGGTELWVPRDINHWLTLDENEGEEQIFVAAGPEPIPELEEVLTSGTGGETQAGDLVTWLESSRGPGEVVEGSPQVPEGAIDLTNTIDVVRKSGSENLVYGVTFNHVGE